MEMKVVNLKIKIKEVKEEVRKLTIEEWAVYLLSKNENSVYQDDAQAIVKSWGFVEFVNGLLALFRTETIRDATQNEYSAWAYLQLEKHCACPECKTKSLDCDDCFLSNTCVASEFKTLIAKHILKGKEVILSVTEE